MPRYNPEEMLISAVLRTGDIHTAIGKSISPNVFLLHKEEWKFIESYNRKHFRVPSKRVFLQKFPKTFFVKTDEVAYWAEEVLQEYHRNILIERINQSIDFIDSDDIEGAISTLSGTIMGIQSDLLSGSSASAFDDYDSLLLEVKDRYERKAQSGRAGISTGFTTLDTITGGLQPGWLVIVAARLGQGKTWSLVKAAWSAVKADASVLFCSLEQPMGQITMRIHNFASAELWDTTYDSNSLLRADSSVDLGDYELFLRDLPDMVSGKLDIVDTRRGRMSPATIGAAIEIHKPSIVFVDYLTLLEQKGDGDHRSIGMLTSELKMLAEKYMLPIVVGAQINRVGVGKEPPKVEHLAGSDAIGQDADLVITMAQQSPEVLKSRLAKFRHGPDGHLWYSEFRPGKGIYEEISGDRAEKIMNAGAEED